ncbi:MAG: hypothetical protein LBU88_00425 [Treponema sp.]|jgi:tetratricopeptide (TPR) repeat protein|nr:hypothetical protein [Treponema sp.]
MTFNTEKLRNPRNVFIIYMLASSLVIMIFKFIFPGSTAPLLIYSMDWRFIQGALLLFNLFPALVLSALVIPFGIVSSYEESYQSFSEMFFKRLSVSVIIAVIAAVIYGIIFFLAFPVVKNREENMRFTGELYRLSKLHMQDRCEKGEWKEAAQFLAICERIWYNSPELTDTRIEINRKLDEIKYQEYRERDEARAALIRDYRSAGISTLSGGIQPVNAAEALSMARAAFSERRFFDAHWLATLAGRLAVPGTPEVTTSARLSADAWNEISSLAPNFREEQKYKIYELKLEGYQAMNTGDWIRAFYIFQELIEISPDDPDVKNFLAASEIGAKETAFFIDEMELSLGDILTGAVFSLPSNEGRIVMRFDSLTTSDDVAYGMGFEYMSFDTYSQPVASVRSRYAKLQPIILNNNPQIMVLMHALDREDKNTSYDSEYLYGVKTPGGILLNFTFEDLMLLGELENGLSGLQMDALFKSAKIFNNAGYVYQIFHAEILNRLGSALFFLPMAIFIIVIGWRYRAMKRPRYLFAVMLLVLPVVFNGFVFIYRSVFNTLGIWLVLNMGFAGALTIYIVVLAAGLFASLITLAAQHT